MSERVIAGFKELLKEFNIVDAGEVDEMLVPAGSTALQINNIVAISPEISDSVLTLAFLGMTTADADPDKRVINRLFNEIRQALASLTIADIRNACNVQAELWYLLSAVAPSGGEQRIFQIQYNLVIQNF